MGLRFFFLVFLLDAAKGFLPTWFLPRSVASVSGEPVPNLAPLIALAAILGHNFPVYLKFKGGKGVATSLGALFALDVAASLGAVVGFVVFLLLTKFVSLASLLAGLAFVGVHFKRVAEPFAPEHRVMTVLTFALLALLFYRHRKNLGRIAAGTEPKVNLRKKRAPEGKVRIGLVLLTVAIAAGTGLALNAARRPELIANDRRIVEVARFATGHQRVDRVLFLDGGKLLAATCPRYMRVVLIRVTDSPALEIVKDITLTGRPVALAEASGLLYVLQRPHGDARHLEEAWWETFDASGNPVGSKLRVGWDPDDLAISPDGKVAYVLTSGSAEGETNRPAPALFAFDLTTTPATRLGAFSFTIPKDDPERLTLLPNGRIAVTLRGSNALARIDAADPSAMKPVDRIDMPKPGAPESIAIDPKGRLLVGDPEASAYWRFEDGKATQIDVDGGVADILAGDGLIFATLPRGSGIAVLDAGSHEIRGKLSIRGTANLATTRPLGLAYSPERKLLAVSNRAGGSVHLIAVE